MNRILRVAGLIYALYTAAHALEPLSTVLAVGAVITTGIGMMGKPIYCTFKECCDQRWISDDFSNLTRILEDEVYGQHLVVRSVSRLIPRHFKNEPQAALVLSFHGWTGTGKNHVAKIIAKVMYEKGLNSDYVHILSGTKDFPRQEHTELYKDELRSWIQGNVTNCPNQLFIFDEVDKMPDGLLDVLSPFIDNHENLGGVDYRRATFIFLSNAGGKVLFDETYKHWLSAQPREHIELKDIEDTLLSSAFQEKGGLKDSALIQKGFISYVPFLPLERKHVEQCIEDNYRLKHGSNPGVDIKERVLKTLRFIPNDIEVYSATGCKRVHQKVDYIVDDDS